MQATVDDEVHAVVRQETEATAALAVRVLKPKFSPEIVMLADCPPHQGEFREEGDDANGAAQPGIQAAARKRRPTARGSEPSNENVNDPVSPKTDVYSNHRCAVAPAGTCMTMVVSDVHEVVLRTSSRE